MINLIFKDSVVYGLGAILPRAITFMTIPILVRYLSPEQYGTLELLATFSSLMVIILSLGLDSSLSYYFFKYKRQRANLLKTILIIRLIGSVLFFLFIYLLIGLFGDQLFGLTNDKQIILLILINSVFFQLFSLFIEIYRLEFKPKQFIFLSNLHSISSTILSVLFCVKFGLELTGYFIGLLVPTLLSFFILAILRNDIFTKGRYDHRLMVRNMKFGIPMLPAALSMYVITSLDKWMINYQLGPSELAVYALGVKLALIFKLAIDVFRKAWWPHAAKAMSNSYGINLFRLVSLLYAIVVSVGVIVYSILIPVLLSWIGGDYYKESQWIAMLLILESAFYGYFMIGCLGMWKMEKTYINTVLMVFAALLNILLNITFIPMYGIFGAAFATIISSFIWLVISIFVSNKLWNVGLNNKITISLILSSFLFPCLFYFFHVKDFVFFLPFVILYFSLLYISFRLVLDLNKKLPYEKIKT